VTQSAHGGLEVADVIRRHCSRYSDSVGDVLSIDQRRVLRDLAACRTATLGGHIEACEQCDHRRIAYNSCRNRHCPKCQATARARWLEARAAELLPVPYFHVIFTVPRSIAAIALQNKRAVYGALFHAASQTLLQIAADPKHLGAQIGVLAVLHTWGQNLMHHPHLHCVVPGGGLSPDDSQWLACRQRFFLPVRVLSKVFRGKFVALLREAYEGGKLTFYGKLARLSQSAAFEQRVKHAVKDDWVVYAKRPFGGPKQVLKYLARYTHRVAISNRRLISMDDGKVTFSWKDYARGHHKKAMTLDATEFLRRFLMHVLPPGLMRIRNYGFLANRSRRTKLELCRQHLRDKWSPDETHGEQSKTKAGIEAEGRSDGAAVCPACNGRLVIIERLQPRRHEHGDMLGSAMRQVLSLAWDTS